MMLFNTNALTHNPMKSKTDFQQLVNDLFKPLIPYFEKQGALVDFGDGGASFDMKASSLEGVARPLWGIIPLVLGGGQFDYWHLIRQAIAEGTDPNHPHFWGDTGDINQRSVEMAAIGLLLASLPEESWFSLTPTQQSNLASWLAKIQKFNMPQNNWLFFTIMVQEGLKRVERYDLVDQVLQDTYLERLKNWYLGSGWYADGDVGTIDHYGGFAMHYYSLLYASCIQDPLPELAEVFKVRACEFAKPFQYWFADTGECLVQGRSLTYRFATASFWGALAVAELEPIPLGEIKGIWARQIRSWKDKPIFTEDGRLTRGYAFPNLQICEFYNSPTSPYWAMKAFLPLLLADNSRFWTVDEEPMNIGDGIAAMPANMTIAQRISGHSIVHYGAPIYPIFQKDKYNKFAYSTFGGMDTYSLLYADQMSFGDNILAISFDRGANWQMRQYNRSTTVIGNQLITDWVSGDFEVKTTITVLDAGQCIRQHEFEIMHDTWLVESGFAVGQWYRDAELITPQTVGRDSEVSPQQSVIVQGEQGISQISSQDDYPKQAFLATRTHSDVSFPRSAVPFLLTKLTKGKHRLVSCFSFTLSSS